MLGPEKASDLVVRPHNFFNSTPESGPEGIEVGFFGLEPPAGRILLMTGFTWGVHGAPGTVVELTMKVTSGTPNDSHWVAPLALDIPPGANAVVRTETFPMPVPLFRGQYKHLCLYRRSTVVSFTLGVETHWLFGFWAADT